MLLKHTKQKIALGIDIGGTKIMAAVADDGGKILGQSRVPTPSAKKPEPVMEAVYRAAEKAATEAGASLTEVSAAGIAVAGVSNPALGIIHTSPNLTGFTEFAISRAFEEKLGIPPYLINDANAGAVGEHVWGAGRGAQNLIFITLSTGIGGGIIIDGALYTGATGAAGEIGHMVLEADGPPCPCGNRGCWEQLASGTALACMARERIKAGALSNIIDMAGGNLENITAEAVGRAAATGDSLAGELMASVSRYLGVGLANLLNLFNPEIIVIGGGLSKIGKPLLEPAYAEAGKRAFTEPFRAVKFAGAEMGDDFGVLGAAAHALENYNRK
ncbi:ROK family protein [Chloroflexota bacterium]